MKRLIDETGVLGLAASTRPRGLSGTSLVFLGAALLVLIEGYALISPILFSLLLIFVISLAMNPVIAKLRAFTGGRRLATGLVAVGLLVLLGLTAWAFLAPMKTSMGNLAERLPEYWERLQKPLIKIEKQAVLSEEKLQQEVTNEINRTNAPLGETFETPAAHGRPGDDKVTHQPGPLRSGLGQLFQRLGSGFTVVAFNASQMLVVLVTVFFGVTFTLMNPRPILGSIFLLVPEAHHERTSIILRRIARFLPKWAMGTVLGMVTIGTSVFLLLWPIFGFADALVLGLIAGMFEAIPFVGPILSAIPGLLLAIGRGGATPVWVLLCYLSVQALENNVIIPLIMARSMKLNPLAVIFSMLVCVAAFGVLGVLVAPPLVSIVSILHEEIYRKKWLPRVTDQEVEAMARRVLRDDAAPTPRPGS